MLRCYRTDPGKQLFFCSVILSDTSVLNGRHMDKIDRRQYPELNTIMWDMHCEQVEPKVAFDLYERRWRYIDTTRLTEDERALVLRLTNEFGNGIFMPA